MDPSGIYLHELESFTDDLSKYDAKLYLGLDDLSIARRAAVSTQKEAATSHPHPPPPLYVPGKVLSVDHQQTCSLQPPQAPGCEGPNVAFKSRGFAFGAPRCSAQYQHPQLQHNQLASSQRPASATLYQAPQPPSARTPRPASSGIIYTSATLLKNKLAEAPAQRQDNLFIRSTTTYREPAAVPCRLPVIPQPYYDYYTAPGY